MIAQLCIAFMSLAATYLSLHRLASVRRFACVFGIAVQPFWMATTYASHQWGMFALCFVYGGLWIANAWRNWAAVIFISMAMRRPSSGAQGKV